jgi:hypothetical protein
VLPMGPSLVLNRCESFHQVIERILQAIRFHIGDYIKSLAASLR